MQFGKFHGLILVTFGFLLFAVQAWMYFQNAILPEVNTANSQETSRSAEKPVQQPHVNYLPAIVGAFAITTGGILLLVHHERLIEARARELEAASRNLRSHGRA